MTEPRSLYTLTASRSKEIIDSMRDRKVVVLGDVMLDEFVWGDVTRISPEAPVPVVDVQRESVHLGGAANVLANLIALGVSASVVGVIGKDAAGERLQRSLAEVNPAEDNQYLIIDEQRPSTVKTRIIAHSQLVVRADRELRTPVNGQTESRIIDALKQGLDNAHALIISDYDKGVVTPRILEQILPIAYKRVPVLVDPKIRNFSSYRPATLITPNHHEALRMTNLEADTDENLWQAAKFIRQQLSCDAVLITRGSRGMMLLDRDDRAIAVATAAREVYDVTGAGDTVIATLAAALAADAKLLEAAILANNAAGIVVGKVGTATANANELIDSFN